MNRTEEKELLRVMIENVGDLRKGYLARLHDPENWSNNHRDKCEARVRQLMDDEIRLLAWYHD